ncbi:MAG: RIP metalloprotease RseP [Planctomycetaceae bacterium]
MEFIDFETLTLLAATGTFGSIGKILSVVLGLGLVIFFHELGHFAVAKWCDVHVERFSIGIGPIIWSRQKGETEYALSALPFGGYVKMLGQDDMDPNQMTSDEIAENPRSYSAKKVWQRMAIISAGVIMNVITGCLFFALAYRFGVVELVAMVGNVHPGTPAWEAGLQEGDVITSINGDHIKNFTDINQAIVLSDGPVVMTGTRADGEEFTKKIIPKQGMTARVVGIGPAMTSKFAPEAAELSSLSMPGLPSEEASQPFRPGDNIVAMNDRPVRFFHDMVDATARMASEDIVYKVERPLPVAEDSEPGAAAPKTETIEITVPPMKMKSLGLWMAIGAVTSIADDSIAQKAGLKLGDQITSFNGLEVGKDIDPLRLPNYFAEQAGQEVTVTVKRQTDDGKEDVTLTMTPSDAPGWADRPGNITQPLPISSIGAGFHVQPWIAKVVPDSEASRAEPAFQRDQKIWKVELRHPDPKNFVPDALSKDQKDAADFTINFAELKEKLEDGEAGDVNWAWVFAEIQRVPNRQVNIFVSPGAEGNNGFAALLKEHEFVDDWYLPMRGLPGFEQYVYIEKADSTTSAMSLGLYQTKRSGISIFLTLKSLFSGSLSVRAFSGPLGILKIGYMVADNGVTQLLKFLGFLSINLAVLNFLPIPVLDGGHMVFLIWEAVARKKPSPQIIGYAHGIGLIFIISLFVFVLYLDIFVNRLGFGGS